MGEPLLVRVEQRPRQFRREVHHSLFRKGPLLPHAGVKAFAFDELADQEVMPIRLAGCESRRGVLDLVDPRGLGLPGEVFKIKEVVMESRRQDLDGDVIRGEFRLRAENNPMRAGPDPLHHVILADVREIIDLQGHPHDLARLPDLCPVQQLQFQGDPIDPRPAPVGHPLPPELLSLDLRQPMLLNRVEKKENLRRHDDGDSNGISS